MCATKQEELTLSSKISIKTALANVKKPFLKDKKDDGESTGDGNSTSKDEDTGKGKEKLIKESITDPKSGIFHKGEKEKCFAYTPPLPLPATTITLF